jgi:hypothetical protein
MNNPVKINIKPTFGTFINSLYCFIFRKMIVVQFDLDEVLRQKNEIDKAGKERTKKRK